MKVGEYIRTKDGIIDKVIIEYNGKCASQTCNCKHVSCEKNYYDEDKIIKSSSNIIDLIEAGDYVNGEKITRIVLPDLCGDEELTDKKVYIDDFEVYEEWIKSIVTHEQFSQSEYRIGE